MDCHETADVLAEEVRVAQPAEEPNRRLLEQMLKLTHKIERKLGEIVRHHGGRRARCRGKPKILIQEVMATLVVNVRRMAQLLCAEPTPCAAR